MPLRRALLTLWLLPHALLALGGPLPIDSELAAQRDIELEFHNASVTVVVDPAARPWIKAASQRAEPSGAAALSFDWATGPLRVVRDDGLEGAERIVVEVTIAPTQHLVVRGIEIDLTVAAAGAFDGTRDPEDDEAGAAPPRPPSGTSQPVESVRPRQRTPTQPADENESPYRVELDVEGGQVDVTGLRDVSIVAAGAVVRTRDTAGMLNVTISAGAEAEILAHTGPAVVRGTDSDLAIVDSVTHARLELDAANAILRDSRGELTVNSVGALVVLENWQGHSKLLGRDGPIEIRGGVGNANLTIDGAGLDVTLNGWQGKMDFKQSGGTLRADGWEGIATVSVTDGTELDLTALSGPLTLTMKSNSRGRINGIEGQLRAEVAGSDLEFHQVTTLHMKAQRATLVGSGIARLNHFEVATSRVDLDLTETLGRPNLRLRREVRADVRMTAPCFVVVKDAGQSALDSPVSVNGCELLIGRNRPGRRGEMAASRQFLNVTVAPDAELDVEGVP